MHDGLRETVTMVMFDTGVHDGAGSGCMGSTSDEVASYGGAWLRYRVTRVRLG